jgi:two-component system response regulator PilR (NtrC family)
MPLKKIAIIEDDSFLREQIAIALGKEYEIVQAGDRTQGEKLLDEEQPDLALVDLNLPPSGKSDEGIRLIELVKTSALNTVVIVMSGNSEMKATLRAVEAGAYDYFKKPFDFSELKLIIRRALEKRAIEAENERLKRELQARYSFSNIIGQSPKMLRVFDAVKRVADTPATVIILGESGTGKELIARAIHYNSRRKEQPFVSVNCAALPETLVETELFGHERGAFTGAVAAHTGRFELADGGTLFLDEIGSISPAIQAKLLRVLQERSFERVGGSRKISADVRLITATNEDLEKKVKEGQFREDLYYRIQVFPIQVPPLRERTEDLPLLLDHFLKLYCKQNDRPLKSFDTPALQALSAYSWKGNVRELENLVQTVILMSDGPTIGLNELPSYISGLERKITIPAGNGTAGLRFDQAVEQFERQLILDAIHRSDGVKKRAAEMLGIDGNKMKYLCRKYKI